MRPGRSRCGPDLADPNRKVMVKHAAARRATRRLPLGEPPLVITTHAITSFRSSHPDPPETSLERHRALVRRTTVARHESRPTVCQISTDTTNLIIEGFAINYSCRKSRITGTEAKVRDAPSRQPRPYRCRSGIAQGVPLPHQRIPGYDRWCRTVEDRA